MNWIDGLAGWLRNIIAIVLLASLVDLMLPNRTMQRYVRLVAGLFILLTVASPLLQWMKGDFSSELSAGLDTVESDAYAAPEQLAMIEEEGLKWREKQESRGAELVAERLAGQIRADLERTDSREVQAVEVRTERDGDGVWTVAGVSVILAPEAGSDDGSEAQGAAEGGMAPIASIEPVAPVGAELPAFAPADDSAGAGEALGPADEATRARIAALVAARYGVPAERVDVVQPLGADDG